MTEYTGQCQGGPDDGNLITATVPSVPFEVTYRRHLDGPNGPVTAVTVHGVYRWLDPGFTWELHGAYEGEPGRAAFVIRDEEPKSEERSWSRIPAGWEVQAPGGKWYRIISNVQRDGKQYVYLDMGNGEGRKWPRNPADRVTCRPPAAPDATDRALSAFGDGFEIMEDQLPAHEHRVSMKDLP